MRKFISVGLFVVLFFCCTSGWARNVHVTLKLVSLKCLSLTEKNYDQIYFSILEYYPGKKATLLRVPMYPLHWPMRLGNTITNQKLWSGVLANGEAAELGISLMEQDNVVFDPDDLIGTVNLLIRNDIGDAEATWSAPNTKRVVETKTTQISGVRQYHMYGQEKVGHYFVKFLLTVS